MGWKERLSKSIDGSLEATADSAQASSREESGRRLRNEEKKAEGPDLGSKDSSAMNFTERMSNMFAAASSTLRPSSAKTREEQQHRYASGFSLMIVIAAPCSDAWFRVVLCIENSILAF